MTERPQNRHLRPAKPGEIRNPEGWNQYTYRREFEVTIDKLLSDTLSDAERQSLNLPDHIGKQIEGGITRGGLIAVLIVHGAMAGDAKCFAEVLARVWPKTRKHEHSETVGVAAPDEDEALIARLDQIARQRRLQAGGGGGKRGA